MYFLQGKKTFFTFAVRKKMLVTEKISATDVNSKIE